MTDFPFQIVGFDLDGTLLDTHADLAMALNHALNQAGRQSLPIAQVRELIGGGAGMMLERALLLTGGRPDEPQVRAIHNDLISYYRSNIAVHSHLFPGGLQMLDALEARGVKLAVVSNKQEAHAIDLLERLGLAQRFDTIIGGDTLGPGRAKPAPDLLLEMLSRLGGGTAAYVGDTTFDTRAAKAAGLPCIAVSFGFNDAPIDQLGADALVDHFDQLIAALQQL